MKTTTTVSLCLPLLLVSAAGRAAPDPAAVDRVMVYADRAEVTRTAQVTCARQGGEASVEFPSLPPSLDARTLRAEAAAPAEALGVTHRRVNLEEDRDARVAALREELQALHDRVRTRNEQLTTLNERLSRLNAYGQYALTRFREEARNLKPEPARWADLLDRNRAERLEAAGKQAELNAALRKLNREAEHLQRRLDRLAPRRSAEALNATVAVACRGAGQARVSLSYVIGGATWHPEYDLRFLPRGKAKAGKGTAELTVAAVVQQSTGEDWTDAKLVLSTARPRLGAEAPYPAPLYVNGHKVGEQKVLVEATERRDELRGPAGLTDFGPASAALEDKGQSFALTLPRRVTVHADGRPYWMPVDVLKSPAEARLVAVPKLRPYVYHLVEMKNPAPYPLMQGRLHAYRGGSYVGDLMLKHRAPGEPMEVSLGIDEELKVERADLVHKARRAGTFSSTKHLERGYRITVVNRARVAQSVELRESIPVSKVDDVEIELLKKKTTRGFELDKHRGFISWTVKLARAEEKQVDLYYTIHLPEEWQVNVR